MTKNEILAAFKNEVFCIENCEANYGRDCDDDYSSPQGFFTRVKENITIEYVVDNIFGDFKDDEIAELEAELTDLKSVINMFNECNDHAPDYVAKLHIQSVYKEQAAEKKRKSLEGEAANFANKHKTGGVNTLFIQKLLEEMQSIQQDQSDWNSQEQRMERYAICANSGCRDSFWEDNDYENGKFDNRQNKLYDILSYIQEHLPLLWAKYELSQK